MTGRVVVSKDIQVASAGELSEKLDVSSLANGVYTLRANQNNVQVTAHAVIAK